MTTSAMTPASETRVQAPAVSADNVLRAGYASNKYQISPTFAEHVSVCRTVN